jgi:hypothetical protein
MALRYIAKGSTLLRQSSFGVFDGAQQVRYLGERPAGLAIETQSIRPQGFGLTDLELPFDGMNTMARVGYSLRSLSMTRMQLFFDPALPLAQAKGSGIALSVLADSGAQLNR